MVSVVCTWRKTTSGPQQDVVAGGGGCSTCSSAKENGMMSAAFEPMIVGVAIRGNNECEGVGVGVDEFVASTAKLITEQENEERGVRGHPRQEGSGVSR